MVDSLKRVIKTPGAILMGLGSIIGTGIFFSIAIAAQVAGNGILFAIIIAAILAIFNGLSSAQLAAAHPVSGGTYEYGYRFLGSYFGFTAGWMFMTAKSAFGATVDGEAAPLMVVSQGLSIPWVGPVVTISAITAMLGVLIN